MNWNTYISLFEDIISQEHSEAPYDNENFVNYVSLNFTRQNRWFKRGTIIEELKAEIEKITEPQEWILITEPWCGDAAHSSPFLYMASELNDNISFRVNLRDGEDSLIDDYLTNGKSKSIPIMVARDKDGNDLFVWGPRPKEAQALYLEHRNDETKSNEDKKIELQAWYNKNKGVDIQMELVEKLKSLR
jgi:hypothetical protein